jgi:RNA polymerase sigma-70 factor, ECF subfamily
METRTGWSEGAEDDLSVEGVLIACLPRLARVATRLTRSSAEAADLVQETCCRAIEKAPRFRNRSNPFGWLCRILHNICYDRQRRYRRERPLDDQVAPAMELEPIAAWRRVSDEQYSAAVASLSPMHQVTYRRRIVEGESYARIAADLGISRQTVGVRLLRARAEIRLFLEDSSRGGTGGTSRCNRAHGDSELQHEPGDPGGVADVQDGAGPEAVQRQTHDLEKRGDLVDAGFGIHGPLGIRVHRGEIDGYAASEMPTEGLARRVAGFCRVGNAPERAVQAGLEVGDDSDRLEPAKPVGAVHRRDAERNDRERGGVVRSAANAAALAAV